MNHGSSLFLISDLGFDPASLLQSLLLNEEQNLMVTVYSAKGRIVYANPAKEKMSGYTLDEMIGKYPHTLFCGAETSSTDANRLGDAMHQQHSATGEMLHY